MSIIFAEEDDLKGIDSKLISIDRMLDENDVLIETVHSLHEAGRLEDMVKMQEILLRNLTVLGKHVDNISEMSNVNR